MPQFFEGICFSLLPLPPSPHYPFSCGALFLFMIKKKDARKARLAENSVCAKAQFHKVQLGSGEAKTQTKMILGDWLHMKDHTSTKWLLLLLCWCCRCPYSDIPSQYSYLPRSQNLCSPIKRGKRCCRHRPVLCCCSSLWQFVMTDGLCCRWFLFQPSTCIWYGRNVLSAAYPMS